MRLGPNDWEWREMPFLVALIASAVVTTVGVQITSAQAVDPMRALEDARRERLEMDKRFKREKADSERLTKQSEGQAGSGAAPATSEPRRHRLRQPRPSVPEEH